MSGYQQPREHRVQGIALVFKGILLMAKGEEPRPAESGLWAFLKSVLLSGWGTYRTRRLRARQ